MTLPNFCELNDLLAPDNIEAEKPKMVYAEFRIKWERADIQIRGKIDIKQLYNIMMKLPVIVDWGKRGVT